MEDQERNKSCKLGIWMGQRSRNNKESSSWYWVNMIYIVGENYIPVWKEDYASPTKGSKLI